MYFHVENFLTIGELLEILPSLSPYQRQILQTIYNQTIYNKVVQYECSQKKVNNEIIRNLL